jgi:hypothetical protein
MTRRKPSDPESGPVRFEGLSWSLEAIVKAPQASQYIPVSVLLEDRGIDQPQISARVLTPGVVRVKLRFPRYAPPGTYTGRMVLGDRTHDIVAALVPTPYLNIAPSSLRLRGAATGEAFASLTIANTGNAEFTIRPAYLFGVFKQGGLEEALGKSYMDCEVEGGRWFDRLGDHLCEEHGGLVRVQVVQGEGSLAPGELRTLQLRFRFPEKLLLDKVYDGKLEFGSFVCQVIVEVSAGAAETSPTQEVQ